eukprot:gene2370-3180_t
MPYPKPGPPAPAPAPNGAAGGDPATPGQFMQELRGLKTAITAGLPAPVPAPGSAPAPGAAPTPALAGAPPPGTDARRKRSLAERSSGAFPVGTSGSPINLGDFGLPADLQEDLV